MSVVNMTVDDGIALIVLHQPPLNALNLAARSGLAQAVRAAIDDSGVQAIVIGGTERAFSCGADIKELGTPTIKAAPDLHKLIASIESSPKPVIAVMQGLAVGGGLELALACHFRVATAATRLGLPESRLGLIPGAGGTQRLPRAIGLERAASMIVSGEDHPASSFADTRLIDAIIPGDHDAHQFAAAFGRSILRPGQAIRLPRLRDIVLDDAPPLAAASFKRAASPAGLQACLTALNAARGASFDAGLHTETRLFDALAASPEAAALQYAFTAERAARRVDGIDTATSSRNVAQIAVVGGGLMGSGIALACLNAGFPVRVLDTTVAALARCRQTVSAYFDRQTAQGRLDRARADQRLVLLSLTQNYADLGQADVVIEAVFESWEAKEGVFRQLDAHAKPGAILASNTSTLDIDRIASFTRRPADVLGMHFFSPAQVMKLLEVVRGRLTAPDVLATVMSLAEKLKKVAVVSGVCDGFIGNRMVEQYSRQAGFLLDEGAMPEDVDGAIERWGMAMGPFRMNDMAGNDISLAIRARRRTAFPDMRFSKTADFLGDLGRHGQKSSAGWYDYLPGDRRAYPSPTVATLVHRASTEAGLTRRIIPDSEIVDRLLLALVNEGARLLDEGIAARASDIDTVYLAGYGFPRYKGGPMWYADHIGLDKVVATMRRFQENTHADSAFWEPARLLVELVARGERFNTSRRIRRD